MRKALISLLAASMIGAGCVFHNPRSLNPNHMTSAHYALEMERMLGANDEDFQKIDYFLDRVEKRIKKKKNYSKEEARMNLALIFSESQQLFDGFKEGEIFYEALRTKKPDCERSAIPFISAAERLSLPIRPIFALGGKKVISGVETNVNHHVFIRWILDDGNWINYEPGNGSAPNDDHYAKRYLGLSTITNFPVWCIKTRLNWCKEGYGADFPYAEKKAELLKRSIR